jgi:hypothetical protein
MRQTGAKNFVRQTAQKRPPDSYKQHGDDLATLKNAQPGRSRVKELEAWLQPLSGSLVGFGRHVSAVFFACWRRICKIISET